MSAAKAASTSSVFPEEEQATTSVSSPGGGAAYDLHRDLVDAGRDRRDDVRADRRAAQAERDDAAGPAEARGRLPRPTQLPRGARLRRQAGDQACEARRVDTVAEGRVIEHGVRDHGVPYRHSALQTA